ncbi:MAG: hypothetical protein BWY76_00095 [bacterium ADurb.Bin429]|nr:MAG: hypothetical protein BWY76_00095 [bacterium ADurb.Bin429]
MRPLPAIGQRGHHRLMHEGRIRLHAEHLGGEFERTRGLARGGIQRNRYHVKFSRAVKVTSLPLPRSTTAFAGRVMTTRPPTGPGPPRKP